MSASFKAILAREALQAAARVHAMGERPTAARFPTLMRLWLDAFTCIQASGRAAVDRRVQLGAGTFQLTTEFDGHRLVRFEVRDCHTHALLLVGDALGPVFPQHPSKQGASA